MPPSATGTPGVDDVMIIMVKDLENPRINISINYSNTREKFQEMT